MNSLDLKSIYDSYAMLNKKIFPFYMSWINLSPYNSISLLILINFRQIIFLFAALSVRKYYSCSKNEVLNFSFFLLISTKISITKSKIEDVNRKWTITLNLPWDLWSWDYWILKLYPCALAFKIRQVKPFRS